MSNRYALVDADGLVINVVEWDGAADWASPPDLTPVEADPSVSKGWLRVDEGWVAPVEDPEWT